MRAGVTSSVRRGGRPFGLRFYIEPMARAAAWVPVFMPKSHRRPCLLERGWIMCRKGTCGKCRLRRVAR
jgi:hypothetical protein